MAAVLNFAAVNVDTPLTCAVALPGSTMFVTGDASGKLALRSRSGKLVSSVTIGPLNDDGSVSPKAIAAVACMWDASRVVVSSEDGVVALYRVDIDCFQFDDNLVRTELPARALAVSRNNRYVYVTVPVRPVRQGSDMPHCITDVSFPACAV